MPWENVSPADIQKIMSSGHSSLDVDEDLENPFTVVLRYGLSMDPPGRQMSLEQIRDMLAEYLSVRLILGEARVFNERGRWKKFYN